MLAMVGLLALPSLGAAQQVPLKVREANGGAGPPSLSADGGRLAFDSDATNLVRDDSNKETTDPFIRDLTSAFTIVGDRTTRRAHAQRGGRYRRTPGYAISANGQFVVFSSNSRDLGRGGGGAFAIWRRDVQSGQTVLVTRVDADDDSESPAISADGQVVVFESRATNFGVGADENRHTDVYWKHLGTGETKRISTPLPGRDKPGQAGSALNPVVSADGTWVTYTYDSTNLVAGAGSTAGVYSTNALTGVTEAVDAAPPPVAPPAPLFGPAPPAPPPAQAQGGGEHPSISADGNLVMFDSDATDLASGADNGGAVDVFVKNMSTGAVTLVSRSVDGSPAAGDSTAGQITPDGRVAAFSSTAPLAGAADGNGGSDVYVRELTTGVTGLVSVGGDGTAGDGPSANPAISADGRFVAFLTRAPKLTGQPAGPVRPVRADLAAPATFAVAAIGLDGPPRTLIGNPTGRVPLERRKLRFIEGTAGDDFLVTRVQIAVSRRAGGRCNFLRPNGRSFAKRPCRRPLWVNARLQSNLRFSLRTGSLPRGRYAIRTRAFDDRGQVERRTRTGRNSLFFTLR